MMLAPAKKSSGLGDIFRDYVPQQLEEQRTVLSFDNKGLHLAFKAYEQLLFDPRVPREYDQIHDAYDPPQTIGGIIRNKKIPALTPDDINSFFQVARSYECERAYPLLTGIFLSVLLQESYDAGHNEFDVRIGSAEKCSFVASFLQGTAQRPMKVTIHDDVGSFLGGRSEYVILQAGAGGKNNFAGDWIKNSTVIVDGTVSSFGGKAVDSRFIINGDVNAEDDLLSNAARCVCTINGLITEKFIPSEYPVSLKTYLITRKYEVSECTFKTPVMETLEKLLELVPPTNEIIFIEANGKERVVRGK